MEIQEHPRMPKSHLHKRFVVGAVTQFIVESYRLGPGMQKNKADLRLFKKPILGVQDQLPAQTQALEAGFHSYLSHLVGLLCGIVLGKYRTG